MTLVNMELPQVLATVYLMVSVPNVRPVYNPVEEMEPTEEMVLTHVPPVVTFENCVGAPMQAMEGPVMESDGGEMTWTGFVAKIVAQTLDTL